MLDGQLETTREVAGEQVLMMSHGPGGFLGAMALLTDTPYRGTTCAVAETLVFELDGEELRRLAFTHPPLLREFLPAIESVSGAVKGIERDREKLLAVGKLAAGLAHELNNPAAAAARGVATLREYERQRQAAFAEIAGGGAPAEQLAALASLGAEATDADRRRGERLDPLAASDREQELVAALAQRGLPDAFEIASALTEAGLGPEWVDRVAAAVGDDGLAAGLRFVAACAGSRVLLAELEEATTRIADLVGAVRSYSYLDQAPRQTVDIHGGLESTLSLLGHKLREKSVEIVRDFDPELPGVEASGSELNQVWTNLIDNAIDAVGAGGQITLRTRHAGRACLRRDRRQRAGDPRRSPGAHLRRLLHHQARRSGHRPRARHRPAHRGAPPRRAPPRVATRRHPLPGPAPRPLTGVAALTPRPGRRRDPSCRRGALRASPRTRRRRRGRPPTGRRGRATDRSSRRRPGPERAIGQGSSRRP